MNIVYIDEPSYLPQWAVEELRALGTFTLYNGRPSADQIVARLNGADVAIVEWSKMPRSVLSRCESLKSIVLVTTGFSGIDLEAASEMGIQVSNSPGYSRQSVAEHAFGLFLAVSKELIPAAALGRREGTSYLDHIVGTELYHSTLGIVGVGSIGSWIAKLGLGFGMTVLGFSRSRILVPEVEQVPLNELASRSNFVALCLTKTPETQQIFSESCFDLLPSGAVVVSVGGDSSFDQEAAFQALESGHLRGIGLDDRPEHEGLANSDRVIITPGTAWYTQASLDRNINMVIGTIRSFIGGRQRFKVNLPISRFRFTFPA